MRDVNLNFFETWFLPKRILEGMYRVKCVIFCLFFCLKAVYNKAVSSDGQILQTLLTRSLYCSVCLIAGYCSSGVRLFSIYKMF